MKALDYYSDELNKKNTKFFILDTFLPGSNIVDHSDVDFKTYRWQLNKYKKMHQGDLFLYRRPQRSSEFNDKKFYLFGAGKIGEISTINPSTTEVIAQIEKGMVFDKLISEDVLKEFEWEEKTYKGNWRGFFNQYGITEIEKKDFINILGLQDNNKSYDYEILNEKEEAIAVEIFQHQVSGDYHVDDKIHNVKTRGPGQKVFADRVKRYYNYACAITGISLSDFLIASHIIPWKDDKDNRTNPQNGICLSTMIDKAFDKGYISFDDDGSMIISEEVKQDAEVYDYLRKYQSRKLDMTMEMAPNKDFLKWHREHIFKK